jgi:hypothetical protein
MSSSSSPSGRIVADPMIGFGRDTPDPHQLERPLVDPSFRAEMSAGYGLTEPGLVIGSPMLDGELLNEARR